MTKSILILGTVSLICFNSCKKELKHMPTTESENNELTAEMASKIVAASSFISGTLPTNGIVPKTNLIAMGGMLGGNKILVDNMPEKVKTEGWVFAPPRIGNTKQAVNGNIEYYNFHFNNISIGGVGKQAYYVLLATNPNNFAVSASIKGSIFSKADVGGFSFSSPSYFIEKESYEVSKRFIENNHSVNSAGITIPAIGSVGGNYKVLTYKTVNYGDGIDGRFTLNFSGNTFVYAVMVVQKSGESISQMLTRAVNLATTDNFTATDVNKRADGEWHDSYGYIVESSARYGRESGLYNNSEWIVNNTINLPISAGYLGMCLITDQKYMPSIYPEDQTAFHSALVPTDTRRYPAIGLLENASRTYGNYGHYYNITLNIVNAKSTVRNLKLSMAFNSPNVSLPNATFIGYAKIKDGNSTETGLDIKIRLNNPKETLLNFTCAANASKQVTVRFYVPGLITAGHQLIVEALN